MTLTEARDRLIDHLHWRNGDGHVYPSYNIHEVNKALTTAINALRLLDDVRKDIEVEHKFTTYVALQMTKGVWEEVERLK